MNETKKKRKTLQKKKKCSHYIIGASFDSSICFHYFVLLWYVYDLVFWETLMLDTEGKELMPGQRAGR